MTEIVGTVLDGKYEIIRLLGEGGMGAVYEAKHQLIGRRLAVKFLHPQYASNEEVVTRFQREAQAAAAIGHENIIEVTDMGTDEDGAPYIVMEFLGGTDIKDLLADEGALTVERSAYIMSQALSALQAAHDAHIIHRDMKPENIYLISKADKPDYVKLLDFGISKFKALDDEQNKGLTQTGTVLGTPYYMSPEQARGDQNITGQSDIYAMGIILYQMLSGVLPFDAPNYNALLIKILTEDPVDIAELCPDLPTGMADVVRCAMSRDVSERFVDCLEFRRAVLPFLPGSSNMFETGLSPASRTAVRAAMVNTDTNTETPLEMTRSGLEAPSNRKSLIFGGIAAAVLAIGVAVFALGGEDKPAPVPVAPPVAAPAPKPEPAAPEPAPTPDNSIKLKISATPNNASIRIDGIKVTGNPFEGPFVKDGANHRVQIEAEGFEAEAAHVRFDKDQTLAYVLKKAAKKSSSRSSSRRSSSRKSSRSSAKKSAPVAAPPAAPAPKKKRPRRKIDDDDPWG